VVASEVKSLANQTAKATEEISAKVGEMQTAEAPLPTSAQMYNSAWATYSQAFYDQAIGEFREFLRTYPKDMRAQSAQITIGEAFAAQKKLEQAILEYDLASQNYPEGDKKCLALYKKGRALAEQKLTPQATAVFQTVVKDCPGTSEAASAQEELPRGRRGTGGR